MTVKELEDRLHQGAILSLVDQSKLKRAGKGYHVNPCPICQNNPGATGTDDHFTIYPESNSYSSFSGCITGSKGGGIYDYLINVDGLTKKEAWDRLTEMAGYIPEMKTAPAIARNPEQLKPLAQHTNTNKSYQENVKSQYFSHEALEQARTGSVVILSGGMIDAVTIEAITGTGAIVIKDLEQYQQAQDAIRGAQLRGAVVLSIFGNSETGRTTAEAARLPEIAIPAPYASLNDWMMETPEDARAAVREAVRRAQDGMINDVSNYLSQSYLAELEDNRTSPRLETGIVALDEALNGGLYPGLHLIGGEPGAGKTALAGQIADRIAEQGREVLFVSLEMSRFELISRSISRIGYQEYHDRSTSTNRILSGDVADEPLKKYLERYQETIGDKLVILQGDFGLTAADIKEAAERIRTIRGQAPVIILDYLQILPGMDPRKEIRLQVDDNIVFMKRMSRDLNTPVIVIASFSRNGRDNINMGSFKESSGIEYTADSLMALTYDLDIIGKEPDAARKFFKSQQYYPLNITLLKNRRGTKDNRINVEWEPGFNYFHHPIRDTKKRL